MKIEIEKPVVPQFVADAITDIVRYGGTLSSLYSVAFDHPLHAWLYEDEYIRNGREMVLATAFMYGCEVEQPLFYAKIKGWDNENLSKPIYWIHVTYEIGDSRLGITCFVDNTSSDYFKTKTEWNALGINDSNADFEEVE